MELSIDIIKEIMLFLNIRDIINISKVNRKFKKICGNNDLWVRKYKCDFVGENISTINNIKQYYLKHTIKMVPVLNFKHEDIGKIMVYRGVNYKQIIDRYVREHSNILYIKIRFNSIEWYDIGIPATIYSYNEEDRMIEHEELYFTDSVQIY